MQITVSTLNTLPVVVFKNNARGGVVEAHVYATMQAAEKGLAELVGMPHIEIVAVRHAAVKGLED